MYLRELHRVERPRERLESAGPGALSDRELVALLLGTGTRGKNVLELSEAVLAACPDGLARASLDELSTVEGVGPARAAALVAALELGRRAAQPAEKPRLDRPERVLAAVPDEVLRARKEHLLGFYLDARSQLLGRETVSIGTLSASLVHPREVFKPAILESAASVILIHNHPSGDPTPSREDIRLTRQLVECARLLDLRIHDHVIVGRGKYVSLAEKGVI